MDCAYFRYCHSPATHSAAMPNWSTRQPLCSLHASRRTTRHARLNTLTPNTVTPDLSRIPLIYLICFDEVFSGHCRHYMGSTTDLPSRLFDHSQGNGSRLMRAVTEAGIGWRVVRTWRGGRVEEARMKRHGHLDRLCPDCRPRSAAERKTKRVGSRRYPRDYKPTGDCAHRRPHKKCRRCKTKQTQITQIKETA